MRIMNKRPTNKSYMEWSYVSRAFVNLRNAKLLQK